MKLEEAIKNTLSEERVHVPFKHDSRSKLLLRERVRVRIAIHSDGTPDTSKDHTLFTEWLIIGRVSFKAWDTVIAQEFVEHRNEVWLECGTWSPLGIMVTIACLEFKKVFLLGKLGHVFSFALRRLLQPFSSAWWLTAPVPFFLRRLSVRITMDKFGGPYCGFGETRFRELCKKANGWDLCDDSRP